MVRWWERTVDERRKLGLVERSKLGDHVLGVKRSAGVGNEIARLVVRPLDWQRGVSVVLVDVHGYEERRVGGLGLACGEQDVVSLARDDTEHVHGLGLGVGCVGLDDGHVVVLEVQHERGNGAKVEDAETVGLARLEDVVGGSAIIQEQIIREGRLEERVRGDEKLVSDKVIGLVVVPVSGDVSNENSL